MALTLAGAERRLRQTLPHVIVRRHKLRHATAQVDVGNSPHLLLIDPHRGAPLDCLVHELIHVAFLAEMTEWGELEEPVVEAIEDQIVRYINRSQKRIAWWRRKLDGLLAHD